MSDLSSQPTPLQTIYNWYRSGLLVVNRNYQRKLVWTLEEKQKLIDSILNAYPIPLVLLAEVVENGQQHFEIMDGLQRLHTVVSFIEHGFTTTDGKNFNVDEFTRAKEEREKGTFQEKNRDQLLARSEVSKILDYILPVSVVRHATENEITDIFGRINSYGHRLSDQERRQAGLLSDLAKFVRVLSSEIRGDVSLEKLPLSKMPEISVDLASTDYGYSVKAADSFWVKQGILRSTDLRDSQDEQVVADLSACILGEDLIERSKDALDTLYEMSAPNSATINAKLKTYDSIRLGNEIKYCIELIDTIADKDTTKLNLRRIIFKSSTTNPYPTVFSAIFLAIHELSFKKGLVLADSAVAREALNDIQSKMNTSRNALSPLERRKNINLVKGLIQDAFVVGDVSKLAYGNRRELDIENTLRRSAIELPSFEAKQGILSLVASRNKNDSVFDKVIQTLVAIANIGPNAVGAVFVGVADNKKDAERIAKLDSIKPVEVAGRWIVGIDREAKAMNITVEKYYHLWRDAVSNSTATLALKNDVLSHIDLCRYKDLHILIMSVPSQKQPSLVDGRAYNRVGDQTVEASPEDLLGIASRFAARA